MSTTNILDLTNRVDDLEKAISGGDSAQANKSDIATEFSATTNYTAGCFVYYEGKLYQFNTDHSAGAWDATDVVEANVTDQIVSNKAAIDGLTASDIMMSDGVTSVGEAVDGLTEALTIGTVVTDGVATLDTWIVTDAPIESTGLYSVMYISNAGMRYQLILLGANLSTIQNPIGMTGNVDQTNNILLAKDDETNKLKVYVSSGVGTGAYYVAKLMDLLETV